MSTISAKTATRRVLFVVYPGVTLLDVTGPVQVFSSANIELDNESVLSLMIFQMWRSIQSLLLVARVYLTQYSTSR